MIHLKTPETHLFDSKFQIHPLGMNIPGGAADNSGELEASSGRSKRLWLVRAATLTALIGGLRVRRTIVEQYPPQETDGGTAEVL